MDPEPFTDPEYTAATTSSAAGSGADPTAGPVAPTPATQKVDQKITILKDLSQYDTWLKDVEKFRTVYGGKLDAEDLAYRIEKACQIKDVSDQLVNKTFTNPKEVLDAVQAAIYPFLQAKKFKDFLAWLGFIRLRDVEQDEQAGAGR